MRGVRPLTSTDARRRELARDLLADLRRLDRQLSAKRRAPAGRCPLPTPPSPTSAASGTSSPERSSDRIGDLTHQARLDQVISQCNSAIQPVVSTN
jgi:hypothetical protein